MPTKKYIEAVVAIILLIVLVFITQLIVGVFGTASTSVNASLVAATFTSSIASVASANALNYNALAVNTLLGGNTLIVSITGTTFPVNASNPLTIAVTGNAVANYASNAIFATPGNIETQTFTTSNTATGAVLTSTTGNFYNISSVVLTPTNKGKFYPSITATVTESYNGLGHGSCGPGCAGAVNTIVGSGTTTINLGQAVTQYNAVGGVTTTIIPFVTVVIIVALVVILLDLFGVDLSRYFKGAQGE